MVVHTHTIQPNLIMQQTRLHFLGRVKRRRGWRNNIHLSLHPFRICGNRLRGIGRDRGLELLLIFPDGLLHDFRGYDFRDVTAIDFLMFREGPNDVILFPPINSLQQQAVCLKFMQQRFHDVDGNIGIVSEYLSLHESRMSPKYPIVVGQGKGPEQKVPRKRWYTSHSFVLKELRLYGSYFAHKYKKNSAASDPLQTLRRGEAPLSHLMGEALLLYFRKWGGDLAPVFLP